MAILFHKLPFTQHKRRAVPARRRAVPWVEELESRYVLATVGPLPASALLLTQLATVGAQTPALVQQTLSGTSPATAPGTSGTPANVTTGTVPAVGGSGQTNNNPALTAPGASGTLVNLTTGIVPFIVGSGQTNINPALTAFSTIPLQVPAPGTLSNALLPAANTYSQLPPILQGTTVVPPSGPLTFADMQVITANFIGGGHTELPPGPNARPSNPPSTPRQMPNRSPAPQSTALIEAPSARVGTTHLALETREEVVPWIVGFDEMPQLLTDQSEEILHGTAGSVGLHVVPSAAPVLAAALAAYWADRHRRPEDDDENDEAWKKRVLLSA